MKFLFKKGNTYAGSSKVQKNCEFCNKSFFTYAYSVKKGQGKFCSMKCCGQARIGKKLSNEIKEKLSLSHLGLNTWMKGKVLPKEWRENIARKSLFKKNEAHVYWKGENVSYAGLHIWVNKYLGKPCTCEFCGTTGLKGRQIHWANKSHDYKRDLSDWLRLCVNCHRTYDRNNQFQTI